ncbi:MAG: hypothetical protein U5J94_01710 [Thiohalophilus sp.]|nr:hypothetical protein [Thiohalophilus sp.]MDZ7661083.1 hypothetical protein [Thiohalophilus sp.]
MDENVALRKPSCRARVAIFLPHHVWYITLCCHRKDFLLKFAKDRLRWRYWLYQAKNRFGLCVLNHFATFNHIHLLVRDRGEGEMPGRCSLSPDGPRRNTTGEKAARGWFREDRYHATAVDSEGYLARCMVYIDLSMVRAGVVRHPAEWAVCSYREIQQPPQRYTVIDRRALCELLGFHDDAALRQQHADWIEAVLAKGEYAREPGWTESLAVGEWDFLEAVKSTLGHRSCRRVIDEQHGMLALREPVTAYCADLGGESPL